MSICAFYLQPARVTIVTDTAAFNGAGEFRAFTSKVWCLPHIQAVMVGRGSLEICQTFYQNLLSLPLSEGIDSFGPLHIAHLQGLYEENIDTLAPGAVLTLEESSYDVLLFGWSERRRAVRGIQTKFIPGNGLEVNEIPPGYGLLPTPPDLANTFAGKRKPKDIEILVKLAKLQVAAVLQQMGGWGAGGEMVACDLGRFRIELRKIGHFDNHPNLMDQIKELEPL